MDNRLQFRYHEEVFDTREAAREYIKSQIRFAEEGLASEDSRYGFSLLSEPTVLLYKNVTEEDPTGEDDPHLMLVIGSKTNTDGVETGHAQYSENRFCFIDIDKTEQEIADLQEEIEALIKSLTIITLNTDTLNLYSEKTDDGTYVSGDVKVAETHIFDDVRYKNNLMVTPDGLFIYVNLEYDPENEQFTFAVSNADGTLTETTVDLSDNYLVGGYYDKTDESIHLQMKDGEEIVVDCEDLIAEWGVEGEGSKTPVVLTREEVDYDHTDEHHHVEPWQDVLRADVRIKDEEKVLQPNGTYKYEKDPRSTNILDRTTDGRYLYVDGKASNIIYYMNGEKSTVKNALDELQKIKLSSDSDNILINKVDGFFASSKLEYVSSENKLIFKTSGHPDKVINLNSVELFEHVYYDPTRETLVLTYKDNTGQTQFVEIPIGEMIRDWEWEPQNEGHNVKIVKKRNVSGNDKVSADAKIFDDPNNILIDRNHELFVRGTADNIKYENGTVKDALDSLKDKDEELDGKIDAEIARATAAEAALDVKIGQEIADRIADVDTEEARAEAAEQVLDNKIGTGFTDDPHENVTYKFEQLQSQVNDVADNLQNEIDRSTAKDTEHDGKIQTIEDEIGDGFGPRNTVRDEIDREKAEREAADEALQNEIDALSGQTASKLQDINSDNSINIDKTEPTVPVISVNLSTEVEDERKNIIKLNNDGLYANVDLDYIPEANKLIFHKTDGSADKEIQLDSMSSIISIEYNPTKEAIVITYLTNGHEIKTVEIPVGDLIEEWRVEDGHPHAVQLEKVREASGTTEKDVLKASVVITDDHDDNILVMDDGALYVSGSQIEQNKQDIADLKTRMSTAENDIDNIEASLAAEIARSTSADATLDAKITQEISDRIADVDAEETRAKVAESALTEAIQNEISRATSEEQRIEAKIDNEITRSTAKDQELTNAINNEVTRATSAETALQTAINNEVTRATNAETNLRNDLTTTQTGLQNEISRATSEEQRIEAKIDNEITRSIAKDQELSDAISAEATRAASAETTLQTAISNEVTRATNAETNLRNDLTTIQTGLQNEISRATSEEQRIETKIDNEVVRSTAKDQELTNAINSEVTRATSAETALQTAINNEVTRATNAESALNTAITNEITRATAKDSALEAKNNEIIAALQQEITDREEADAELAETIRESKLAFSPSKVNFDDNGTIEFNKYEEDNNIVKAKVKIQDGDNIIKDGNGNGIYATVHLDYNEITNKLKLITSAGEQEFQLIGLSVLESITYDPIEKELVITYKDGNGTEQVTRFGVEELFNDWIVVNLEENSAVKLWKTPPSAHTAGNPDILNGRILITDDHNGDGKPDQGSDNIIEIRNNGLYVNGSVISGAAETAECVKNELKAVERAVIGHIIGEECGNGYTYEKNTLATYINNAISFYDADFILDQNIKRVENYVDVVSANTDCVDGKANKIYELLYGSSSTMSDCGSNTEYRPHTNSCIISAATSFDEADQLLNDTICQMMSIWESGETCTAEAYWEEENGQNKLQVDAKLSRGRVGSMTDSDIITTTTDGAYIDPTTNEFTDTNALRIVCLPNGVTLKQNGIYLSNIWDCGLYYGASDSEAKAKAEAAGYNTNYSTDESPSASNINYMNNVR